AVGAAPCLRERLTDLLDARDRIHRVVAPGNPAAAVLHDAVQHVRIERPADPERDAAGMDRLGVDVDLLEACEPARMTRGLVAPERLTDLERLVEQLAAALVLEAVGLVLLALPAHADADVEAPLGEHVEGRELLGERRRAAQRRNQDAREKARPL